MAQNDNYIGIAMGLDVSDLKAGISEANKRIKEANSQFKAAASGMDDWQKSTDGLQAKITQLDTVLKAQESKLKGLRAEYEKVAKEQGENSEAARNLRIQINNQEAALNTTKKELSNYRETLQKAEDGTINLEEVTLRAGKAVEKAGKQTEKAGDQAKEAGKEVEDAGDQAKEAGDEAEDSADGFTVLKGAFADLVADGIRAASQALKDFIVDTDSATSNFAAKTGMSGEALAQFEEQINDLYKNNYGESLNDVADAMATVAQNSKETDPTKLKELTQHALTLRDTFGYEITEQMRAVNMLMDQFGLTGTEAYNLIVQGAQKGLDKNGDLLDTINEYGVHYQQLGYTADEFFNSLLNGTAEGTFSVDKLGDAMKEFGIRTKDTAKSTTEAFEKLGYGVGDNSGAINDLKEKIAKYEKELKYATLQQKEFNQKASETSSKEAQKLADTIANLEEKLKYAKIEQSEFNEKTSEVKKAKVADNIAKYSEQLEEAKKKLSELASTSESSADSLAVIKNNDKIAEYSAKLQEAKKALELTQKQGDNTRGSIADLQAKFAEGGEAAREATDEVLDALFSMEDGVEKNAVGVALFGTMWEDLGEDAIKALMDTNGEIEETEEAMEELNDVKYSDVGSEFKALGREIVTEVFTPLAKKAIPKLKEFTKYLKDTNAVEKFSKFVGKLAEEVGWLFNNLDIVLPLAVGLVGVFKGFTIVSTLTTLVKTFTGVFAGLNAVMAANPVGAIVTAVSLLATGIAAAIAFAERYPSEAEKEMEAIRQKRDAIIEARDAQDQYIESAQKTAFDGVADLDYLSRLKDELGLIVDANGKVKEGYEDRVQFILNELNGAFGTEYQLVDGVIQKYGELKQEITDLIAIQRAETILNSYKEAYDNAIKLQSTYLQTQAQAEKDYLAAKKEYDDLLLYREEWIAGERKRINEDFKDYDQQYRDDMLTLMLENYDAQIANEKERLAEKVTTTEEAYDAAKETVSDALTIIAQYEADAARIASGNADEIELVNNRVKESYVKNGEIITLNLQEQIKQEQIALQTLKDLKAAGNKDITDAQILAAEERIAKLQGEIEAAQAVIEGGRTPYAENWRVLQQDGLTAFNDPLGQYMFSSQKAIDNAAAGANGKRQFFVDTMAGIGTGGETAFETATDTTEAGAGSVNKATAGAERQRTIYSKKMEDIGLAGKSSYKTAADATAEGSSAVKTAATGAEKQRAVYSKKMENVGIDGKKSFEKGAKGEEAGGNIVSGIIKGIGDGASSLYKSLTSLAKNAWDSFMEAIDSNSPSKLFGKAGITVPQGVAVGVTEGADEALQSVRDLGSDMVSEFDLSGISTDISSKVNGIKNGIGRSTATASGANARKNGSTTKGGAVIDARMTVNYNGNLSRKELKQIENDHYNSIKMKLKTEGAI